MADPEDFVFIDSPDADFIIESQPVGLNDAAAAFLARDAAEVARDAAIAAQIAAEAAVGVDLVNSNSRAAAIGTHFPPVVGYVRTAGYAAAGDGGGALYAKVVSEPTHGGKFQSADGAWWELAEKKVNALQFGVIGNGVADDTVALQAAINFCLAKQIELYIPGGAFLVTNSLNLTFAGASGAGLDTNMYRGVTIRGKGRAHTKIVGATAGFPVFDMVGARLCSFFDFMVRYDSNDANTPSCAFFMSRNTTNGGAGEHVFNRVGTYGYFTKAAVAEVSSEVNAMHDCVFVNQYPNGHVLYVASQNVIDITSSYIAGMDTHVYVGGNTRHLYSGCAFMHFGATDGTGRAIYLGGDGASPIDTIDFYSNYSITQPTAKDCSIEISGSVFGLSFIGHRDESPIDHSIQFAADAIVNGLILLNGSYSRNIYGVDGSSITKAIISPQQVTTGIDGVTGTFISIDLYDFTVSYIQSPGNNGIRLRNSVKGSRVESSVAGTDLFIAGTGDNLAGFHAKTRDVSGYYYETDYGAKTRRMVNRVNANLFTLKNQAITASGASTPDMNNGSSVTYYLTGNVTVDNISNIKLAGTSDTYGSEFVLTFVQDAVGGRTVGFGANFDLRGATVSLTPNAITSLEFIHVDPTNTGNNKFVRVGAGNNSEAFLLARANHTGTQSADTLTDGTTNKAFLATERTKLAGVATGATANDTDANLKARANHTGTQLAATISDFASAVAAAVPPTPFTQAFESSQQTISNAGLLTIAHGLGVKPKLYLVVLQCTTAELGYSIGDEVMAPQTRSTASGGGERGISMVPDATNINIRYAATASPFELLNKTTGVVASATNANWRLVVRAWA